MTTTTTTSSVPVQVLFDSQQRNIVYAEAKGKFVDGLCKLLVAPLHEVIRFAGPLPPEGGYPSSSDDHLNCGAGASLPLVTLSKSISDLDDSVFSNTGDVESLPYFEVPCALKIFDDKDTDKDTDDDDDDDSSNNEEDGDSGDDDDENHTEHYLKPRARLLVSNNLVSEVSSIKCVDLLRRYAPDSTRWAHFCGVTLDVDEDDFKAIARSALAGRSCVLQDALGAKAAAAFEKEAESVCWEVKAADGAERCGGVSGGPPERTAACTLSGGTSIFTDERDFVTLQVPAETAGTVAAEATLHQQEISSQTFSAAASLSNRLRDVAVMACGGGPGGGRVATTSRGTQSTPPLTDTAATTTTTTTDSGGDAKSSEDELGGERGFEIRRLRRDADAAAAAADAAEALLRQTAEPLIDLNAEPVTPGTPTESNDSFEMFE